MRVLLFHRCLQDGWLLFAESLAVKSLVIFLQYKSATQQKPHRSYAAWLKKKLNIRIAVFS